MRLDGTRPRRSLGDLRHRLRSRSWHFRDGLLIGASGTGLVALLAVLAGSGGGEPPRIVNAGLAGPVATASAAPSTTPSALPGTSSASGDPRATSAGSGRDQEPGTSSSRTSTSDDDEQDAEKDDEKEEEVPVPVGDVPRATALPDRSPVSCPGSSLTVGSSEGLKEALTAARPGEVIRLADGVYEGAFVAMTSGTAAEPIWLCGGRGAVLDGGSTQRGYGFHLAGAQHWRLVGFTVRNSQKGVMADGTSGTVVQDLLVEQIGDEAIHLRSQSTGNAVLRNTIRDTGLRRDKFGEGIYVGTAKSNWKKYSGGGPDRSDFNLLANNDIRFTAAESVDIKEGTTGGALLDNTFDGTGMTGGDSWVDVKGNGWLIQGNTGRNTPKDGMQTHRILDGWGTDNVFDGNTIDVPGPGMGIYVHEPQQTANHVRCTNRTSSGAPVTSTVDCSD